MMPEDRPRLYIVDAMPLLYRGYFVFLNNPRMTTGGINTSALMGFSATLVQLLSEENPSHLAVVFDSSTPTFRHERYPAYKAQRQKIPEDLAAAIPMALELMEALRIALERVDGFEADDLMGTLAKRASAEGFDTVLVTPDKDVAQLVDDHTLLYRPGIRGGKAEVMGVAEVCAQWGIAAPARMVDWLALAGDSSDNIPGIAGVGAKTATALLQRFGTLEEVLAHADDLKGKLADRVREGADAARLSYELAQIRCDVPIDSSPERLVRREPDRNKLLSVIETYELTQLGKRLLGEATVDENRGVAGDALPRLADVAHSYTCVRDEAGLSELLARLESAEAWGFDTETTGLDIEMLALVGMSFCIEPREAWYVPVPADPDAAAALLERLRPVLEDSRIAKTGHNLKFDLSVMRRYGIAVNGPLHDSMLASYVLDAAERHGLDHLARSRLGYDPIPITALIGAKGRESLNMGDLPPDEISDYACEDADLTVQLYRKLHPEVAKADALQALTDCEEPLIGVLVDMEAEGIRVDPGVLKEFSHELTRDLIDLERGIHELAGGSFNISSPKQLGQVLFDRLEIASEAARTRTGQYATGEEVLRKLVGKHPIVEQILEYRMCSKLKSTYVDTLPQRIAARTGRVHTTFSQALTETGRLSSIEPNLQNIPIRTERGRRIRAAFVSRDASHRLLSADYSQIELRVMAAFSRDEAMIADFSRGADIHRETAARVHGIMPEFVTDSMRSQAKMVNFGIIYGISAYGLSQRLSVPRKQAAELIEAYFSQYPGVRRYMDETISFAREHGFVRTFLGRRRSLRDIGSRNSSVRQAAERNAINTPIQGTAADIIKLAMVAIHREIARRKLNARMVLQVHDELLFDVPKDEVDALRDLVVEHMTQCVDIGVPLDVEVGVGENWIEAH